MPVTFQSVSGGRLSLWLQLGWMDGGPAEVAGKEHKKVKWKMLRKCGRSILCGAGWCGVELVGVGVCYAIFRGASSEGVGLQAARKNRRTQ